MEDTGYRPFFLIVIPAHNEEAIEHTLDSLLRQDYDHAAIMVMNDGSKDRTSEIAHEYASNHARVIAVDRDLDIAGRAKARS
jgi:glycosyltransferase involved in cell wall biosynthesis